jgi:hypothetical protein
MNQASPEGMSGTPRSFSAGIEAGLFPRPAEKTIGVGLTTGSSHWLGDRCARCGHTFRRGDQVRVTADGSVLHLHPALDCGQLAEVQGGEAGTADDAHRRGPRGPESVLAFTASLLAAWPPTNGAPVVILSAGDWQVTRPTSGPSSPTCPVCGHTFRAGDAVILCPCSDREDDPRRSFCQLPVHRDPAAGLTCWDDWCPDGRLVRCPRTHEKLPG